MFRTLFFITVFVTLAVNILLLFATKDKPPDPANGTTTLVSVIGQASGSSSSSSSIRPELNNAGAPAPHRLFLRSNDFYDYSGAAAPASDQRAFDKPSSQSNARPGRDLETKKWAPADSNLFTPQPEHASGPFVWLKQRRHAAVSLSAPAASDKRTLRDSELEAQDSKASIKQQQKQHDKAPPSAAEDDDDDDEGRTTQQTNNVMSSPAAWRQLAAPLAASLEPPPRRPRQEALLALGEGAPTKRAQMKVKAKSKSESSSSSSNGNNNINDGDGDDEITRRAMNTLAIRVKSSKNHVLITADNLIIYESGDGVSSASLRSSQQHSGSTAFSRRHRFRQHRSPVDDDKPDANAPANESPNGVHVAAPPHATPPRDDSPPPSQAGRGLHVLVLNQFQGFVMSKRVFDTYLPQQDDELAFYLSQIQDGRLVVLAVQDEASFKLGRSARRLIQQTLGSRRVMELDWRDMWALVGRKRTQLETNATLGGLRSTGETPCQSSPPRDGCDEPSLLAEELSRSAQFVDWAAPVELNVEVSLTHNGEAEESSRCEWSQDSPEVRARRRLFCERVEGYGHLCDCRHPSRLVFDLGSSETTHTLAQLAGVPIVVIASDRPYYLYRMLRSLLQARGIKPELVTVYIDGFYEEPREICKLLQLRYVQQKPLGVRSARISHHYKTALTHTFERLHPEAQFAIIFEEDLDVARDALVFFNQTRDLLAHDETLYCASAWNDQGYEHSVGDPWRLLRVETMPGLGWMLSRRLFEEELKSKWPSARQQHDWDMWIRTAAVRRGRECIIPEVSRTYHFGSTGTNINSYFQRQYFSKHAFSDNFSQNDRDDASYRPFVELDSMDGAGYERLIEGLLQGGQHDRQWFSASLPVARQFNTQAASPRIEDNDRLVVISSEALCALYRTHQNSSTTTNGGGDDNDETHDGTNTTPRQRLSRQSRVTNQAGRSVTVIFIKMIDSEDFKNWLRLAKCWRLWDLDARGQHKSMWRLHLEGRQTLVIGHPASPYSRLRPPQVEPYEVQA